MKIRELLLSALIIFSFPLLTFTSIEAEWYNDISDFERYVKAKSNKDPKVAQKRSLEYKVAIGVVSLSFIYYMMGLYFISKEKTPKTIHARYSLPEGIDSSTARYLYHKKVDHTLFACYLFELALKGIINIEFKKGKYWISNGKNKSKLSQTEKKIVSRLLRRGILGLIFNSYRPLNISSIFSLYRIQSCKDYLNIDLNKKTKSYFQIGFPWTKFGIIISTFLCSVMLLSTHAKSTDMITFVSDILSLLVQAGISLLILLMIGTPFLILTFGILFPLLIKLSKIFKGSFDYVPLVNLLNSRNNSIHDRVFFNQFMLTFLLILITLLIEPLFHYIEISPTYIALLAIALINLFFIKLYNFQSLSNKGLELLSLIEGYRLFLDTAEKDSLELYKPKESELNSLDHKLIHALALDVGSVWGETFIQSLKTGASHKAL